MKKILVDSSFLVAIFRKNDSLHQRTIENRNVLENDCYISNGIISEVITILGQKTKDIALVRLAYNYMKDRPRLRYPALQQWCLRLPGYRIPEHMLSRL